MSKRAKKGQLTVIPPTKAKRIHRNVADEVLEAVNDAIKSGIVALAAGKRVIDTIKKLRQK